MKKIRAFILLICIVQLLTMPAHAQEGMVIKSQTQVIQPDAEGIDVHTILHMVNTSANPQEVVWELPKGLEQLQILVGEPDVIVIDQQKLQRKEPLAGNGEFTMVYKYRYPFPEGTRDFIQPFSYPAEQLQILLPEEKQETELISSMVQKQGPMEFEGKPYILYLGSKINSPTVDIQVKGEPTVPPFHSATLIRWWSQSIFRSMDPHLLTAMVVILLSGGGWLAYHTFRKRKNDIDGFIDEEEQRFLDLYRQSQMLFASLTELQVKADQGLIDSEKFAQMKAGYKGKLVTINLELKRLVS